LNLKRWRYSGKNCSLLDNSAVKDVVAVAAAAAVYLGDTAVIEIHMEMQENMQSNPVPVPVPELAQNYTSWVSSPIAVAAGDGFVHGCCTWKYRRHWNHNGSHFCIHPNDSYNYLHCYHRYH
jgi:hypothetical protein